MEIFEYENNIKQVDEKNLTYFDLITIEKNFQEKGLSYPLMCASFRT